MTRFSKSLLMSAAFFATTVFADPAPATSTTPGTPVGDLQKLQTPKELEVVPVRKFNSDEAAAIVEVVKNFLRTNPAEFMQLMQLSMQFHEAKQEEKTRDLLDQHQNDLLASDKSIILGNPKGTVTMVLISDPLCPNCRFLEVMLRKVINQNPALKIVMHQWAFVSPESARVSKFLHAAWKEDNAKFPKLLEGFLALDKAPSEDEFKALLTGAKYDFEKVKTTANSPEVNSVIEGTATLAKNLEIPGTPILLATGPDGKLLVVPPVAEAEMTKLVSELAKQAKASGATPVKSDKTAEAPAAKAETVNVDVAKAKAAAAA